MYSNYLGSQEVTILVAFFGLAWFLVGVLVGNQLRLDRHGSSSGTFSKRKSNGDGSIEVYVGNLSYDVTDKDLRKAFSAYGKVGSVRVIKNRSNGKSKGYGFVEMPNASECDTAIRALNGKDMKGRRVVVNEAKSSARDDG